MRRSRYVPTAAGRLRAPCGCVLRVNVHEEWAMFRPCSPEVWDDLEHQERAADAAIDSAPEGWKEDL